MKRSFLGILVVVMLAACESSTPSSSPVAVASSGPAASGAETPGITSAPESTVVPTDAPTPEPAETATPPRWEWAQDPPVPLLVDRAVRVSVAELNVRARPSTSARQLGTVREGNILVFRGPPVAADGYIWYRGFLAWDDIEHVPDLPVPLLDAGDPLGGWIAASRGTVDYVLPIVSRCPEVIDIRNVVAMLPAERLSCFDDRTIELEGTVGCHGCTIHIFGAFEPEWLTNPNRVHDLLWADFMEGGSLMLRFRPDGPARPREGQVIRVRGHFRAAAAAGCSLGFAYPWTESSDIHPVGSRVARELCRQEFVVERYDVLGTDPRFGSG